MIVSRRERIVITAFLERPCASAVFTLKNMRLFRWIDHLFLA
jgi:hypothetical protein